MMQDLFIVSLCLAPLLLVYGFRLFRRSAEQQSGQSQGQRLAQQWQLQKPRLGSIGLGLAFCYFALGHVAIAQQLAQMLPPWVPERLLIVHITGVMELGVALALFSRRWRKQGAVVAIILLIAFFPANIYSAIYHVGPDGAKGVAYLWIRVLLQLFLLYWAWWPIRKTRCE